MSLPKKGKGYEPAEEQPDKFHGIGPFQVETGEPEKPKKKDSYTDVFGKVMCDEAARNDKRCGDHCSNGRWNGSCEIPKEIIRTAFLMWGLQKSMR